MDLFTHVKTLPTSASFRPRRKHIGNPGEVFADDLLLNGLVLKAAGRGRVAPR